jgi:phosphatidylethanolamine-binding protein (PEBP) family uncharacterized protein
MTLADIKYQVMFQSNNEIDDVGEFEPHLEDYINDGYDQLIFAYDQKHVGTEDYPALIEDTDVPQAPEWTHRYLADWATWLVYRNGNPQKQNRGYPYRESFLSMLSRLKDEGGKKGEGGFPYKHFRNIPV